MAGKKKLQEALKNGTDGLFAGMNTEEAEPIKEAVKTAQETPQTQTVQKVTKKMFSFRADGDHVDMWKAYIEATGRTAEDVSDAAIMEYMKRHKLTDDQQDTYELKLKLLQKKQ